MAQQQILPRAIERSPDETGPKALHNSAGARTSEENGPSFFDTLEQIDAILADANRTVEQERSGEEAANG
jgi:hypothetical protein